MRRSAVNSIGSHVLVALFTGVLVSNLHTISHHILVGDAPQALSELNVDFPHHADMQASEPELATFAAEETHFILAPVPEAIISSSAPPPAETTTNTTVSSKSRASIHTSANSRIDFSCPAGMLKVAPKVNYMLGMGHRMTECFYVLWLALTQGYCYCLPASKMGSDTEVFHLLLEAVIPQCPAYQDLREMSVNKLQQENLTVLAQNASVIQWVYPNIGDVWNRGQQQSRPRGHGDIISFINRFLNDNHLMEDTIYPWYEQHKTIDSAFRKTNATEDKVVTAAFHLRVGDLVLDASEKFWRNLLTSLRDVVDLENGTNSKVEVYLLYFQSRHAGQSGNSERNKLSLNVIGDWPSKVDMLPPTHNFLAPLCEEFENIECLWKSGTNMHETIDLFVESDVVYVSGSSLAQVLSLFNRGGTKSLIGLPKELNWSGQAKKGGVPFLQTSTGGSTSLRYYYIDGTGALFDEHQAYLKPLSNSRSLVRRS
jgi:hypothetical protein